MPLQYSGILQEHEAVRTESGLFDVSHMGQIMVEGTAARSLYKDLLPMIYQNYGQQHSLFSNVLSGRRDHR